MIIPSLQVDDAEVMGLFRRLKDKIGDLTEPMEEVGALVHGSVIRNFESGGRYGAVRDWKGGSNKWEPLKESTLIARNSRFSGARFKGKEGLDARRVTREAGFYALPPKRRKLGILQVTGRLKNSMYWDAHSNGVVIGTNLIQARILNDGGTTKPHVIRPRRKKALAWMGGPGPVKSVNHPGSKIPARPFLVVQEEDLMEIKEIFVRHLAK